MHVVFAFFLVMFFVYVIIRFVIKGNLWADVFLQILTGILFVIFILATIASLVLSCVYYVNISDEKVTAINLYMGQNAQSVWESIFSEKVIINELATYIKQYRAIPSNDNYNKIYNWANMYNNTTRLAQCYVLNAEQKMAFWLLWTIVSVICLIYVCILARRKKMNGWAPIILFAIIAIILLIFIVTGKVLNFVKLQAFKSRTHDVGANTSNNRQLIEELAKCVPNTTFVDVNEVVNVFQYVGVAIAILGLLNVMFVVAFPDKKYINVGTLLVVITSAIVFFFSILALEFFSQ